MMEATLSCAASLDGSALLSGGLPTQSNPQVRARYIQNGGNSRHLFDDELTLRAPETISRVRDFPRFIFSIFSLKHAVSVNKRGYFIIN